MGSRIVTAFALAALLIPSDGWAKYEVVWQEAVDLVGEGLRDTYIGDVDDDGDLEIVGRLLVSGVVVRDLESGASEFETDVGDAPVGFSMIDIDGDRSPEVIGRTASSVFVIDFQAKAGSPAREPETAPEAAAPAPPRAVPQEDARWVDGRTLNNGMQFMVAYDKDGLACYRVRLAGGTPGAQMKVVIDGVTKEILTQTGQESQCYCSRQFDVRVDGGQGRYQQQACSPSR
jgi:hypothetical protein